MSLAGVTRLMVVPPMEINNREHMVWGAKLSAAKA